MQISGYKLIRTCFACPEQYHVLKGDEMVGYLRLRHGRFTADALGGGPVYVAFPEGDGAFEPHERELFLTEAVKAIDEAIAPRSAMGAG